MAPYKPLHGWHELLGQGCLTKCCLDEIVYNFNDIAFEYTYLPKIIFFQIAFHQVSKDPNGFMLALC